MAKDKRPDNLSREMAPLPTEPFGTQRTTTGTVKWWRNTKGYGAIATNQTAPWDIWCHFSMIEGPGFRDLCPGEQVGLEYVRFDQESFRYRAIRVWRLKVPPDSSVEPDAG
jgi:CspA family cold shock protein